MKSERYLLTIIIPTYNSANSIKTALDSIVNQTWFENLECLIMDGLSTHDTVSIIDNYQFPNLVVSVEKDKGIYDAMNKGIRKAKGEFVYFMGSDDKLFDDTIIERVFSHDYKNYDVLYGNVFNEELGITYDGKFDDEKICLQPICHQSTFYRRTLFEKFGYYNTSMRVSADAYLDKILFTAPEVKWLYMDVVVARYSGTGLSANTMDLVYWSGAEKLLTSRFKGRVPDKIIYKALLPYVRWHFSGKTFLAALKIAWHGNPVSLKYWFNHPFGYIRRAYRKIF